MSYELLDFGNGRKLERFGDVVVDRPCPVAGGVVKENAPLWNSAAAMFQREPASTSGWSFTGSPLDAWKCTIDDIVFELRPSPHGQVGVFPEQHENWRWIRRCVEKLPTGAKVLNLFAYTGGSTLAAAIAGASVVHVDAAANVVQRARNNADLSGLAEHPVRWIADDAVKFCRREVRRGNHYEGIILDPPTYGHGATNEVWRLTRDLPQLLALCRKLFANDPSFMLLSCHTTGVSEHDLADIFTAAELPLKVHECEFGEMTLITASGRKLSSGNVVRACHADLRT